MRVDVAIVGGGLSGLYAALLLRGGGCSCVVLEAQERIGGRILSVTANGPRLSSVESEARYDLGPAWFWPEFQPRMRSLVGELGLTVFPQESEGAVLVERSLRAPPQRLGRGYNAEPRSMRLVGGMQALVHGLSSRLSADSVQIGVTVTGVHLASQKQLVRLDAHGKDGSLELMANAVIVAVPPRLVAASMLFSPELPAEFRASLAAIPTWMGGHAKFMAIYDRAFWREQGLSGTASSVVGPLVELHDASAPEGCPALFGFFGLTAAERQVIGLEELQQRSLRQLGRLFGPAAETPLAVFVADWAQGPFTSTDADSAAPDGHPRYGLPRGLGTIWNERLAFAGTEMAAEFGGYLEGALEAACAAVERIRVT